MPLIAHAGRERCELIPTSLGELSIVGKPIQVLAFRGGEGEAENGHSFDPTPAGMMGWYRNGDHRIEDLGMEPADRGRDRTDLREVCVNRAAYSGR